MSSSTPTSAPGPVKGPRVRYMARRETHSSRAIAAVFLSLLLLAGLIYLGTELVMSLLGYSPLLISPDDMLDNLAYLPERVIYPWLGVGGIVAALLGLWFLCKAVLPGSLNRHQLQSSRSAFVMDDAVLASAVSAEIRQTGNLAEGQVSTSVDRSTVEVEVTPNPGRPVDTEMLRSHLSAYVSDMNLTPTVRTKLNVVRSESA